ncbi:diacylglycerol kinase family protein [Paenibacillus sp. LHD-117]|uniref:diacylglycerol kinase family protein n=1 Tax=Paenibacillus sp. LHD-117 TaxID=3071412 RepID=UPI0027E1FB3F|nr:diacylglycerol kinase family protein [Paenibacillus sp. LHD-117]MDQ6421113.1 diacylglycerol kinase family protein [Paenibacillus sp. LHD-117]
MVKFFRSVLLALSGIGFAIRTQRHMQIHCVAAIIVIGLGCVLSLDAVQWCMILIAIGLVVTAELINTAIEQAVDLASPGRHPLAKAAKDVAAGAVLAAAIVAIAIGLIVLGPPLWQFIV